MTPVGMGRSPRVKSEGTDDRPIPIVLGHHCQPSRRVQKLWPGFSPNRIGFWGIIYKSRGLGVQLGQCFWLFILKIATMGSYKFGQG